MAINEDINNLLSDFGINTVKVLRGSLKAKLAAKGARYGTKPPATSRLEASIQSKITATTTGIKLTINMNNYGNIVDKGRNAANVAESAKIEDWAARYGVAESFRKKNLEQRLAQQGKNKTNRKKKVLKKMPFEQAKKSIGFLVRRKIKNKGFEGNYFMTEVLEDGRMEDLKKKLSELISDKITFEITTK